ncbi:hypothetical protein SPHINGO361_70153 [Sphingomonas sp. EC-HK361]|nr:hypothetical protein SPHINGO361_70153 [Sphingomonas sp. EC-HK361]
MEVNAIDGLERSIHIPLPCAGHRRDGEPARDLRLQDRARPERVAAVQRQSVIEDVEDAHVGSVPATRLFNAASTRLGLGGEKPLPVRAEPVEALHCLSRKGRPFDRLRANGAGHGKRHRARERRST